MTEYTAMVTPVSGGTEAVTVKAHDMTEARRKLFAYGYLAIHWIL